MAANATPVREITVEPEVMLAASAMFGALEIIGDSSCDAATEQRVEEATAGAEACLARLGLTREELRTTRYDILQPPAQPPWARPPFIGPSGNVVPLGRTRQVRPRDTRTR
jgi:hypothetical protein